MNDTDHTPQPMEINMRGQLNKDVLGQFLSMLQTGNMPGVAVNRKKATKSKRKPAKAGKKTEAEIEASRLRNNELVIEAFTKAGFTDVQPRINVLTYDKFVEQGRRVRKGEKATRVGNFPLFHISQTDPIEAAAPAA